MIKKKAVFIYPWQSQILIAACLVASFALPYYGTALFEAYNSRQWAKSAMSQYEIDEWGHIGIGDVDTAVRWRNAGFKPPGAQIWRSEGFSPEDAGIWQGGGFHTGEARIWGSHGFSAREGAAWKEAGFYYPEAERWKKAGAAPVDAQARAKKGEWPP